MALGLTSFGAAFSGTGAGAQTAKARTETGIVGHAAAEAAKTPECSLIAAEDVLGVRIQCGQWWPPD
jgi:hypothetical protein